ncbi:hypothetical protein [Xanthomonas phage RTH11]|nr:hypothetical protein [Xanthomonas phage RTH11]
MENEQSTPAPADNAVNQQFFGISADGQILWLPEAAYPSDALRIYQANDEKPLRIEMVLDANQYDIIRSAVDAELNDVDGDTLIPTYFVIPFHTQHAVFPHPSVDTEEEVKEWLENWIAQHSSEDRHVAVLGPFKLDDVKANWPVVQGSSPVQA